MKICHDVAVCLSVNKAKQNTANIFNPIGILYQFDPERVAILSLKQEGLVMKVLKNLSTWVLVESCFFFVFMGCQTAPDIKMPEPIFDDVKNYKHIRVYANSPSAKNTKIFIRKGELFSVIVSGQVNTNPKNYPKRWQSAERRLVMLIDTVPLYYPVNVTHKSDSEGMIKFSVLDGPFNFERARARNPDWYPSNRGYFDVTIIVWTQDDWKAVSDFVQKMVNLNPEYKALQETLERTNQHMQLHAARVETAKEVEKTKKQIQELKNAEDWTSGIESPVSEVNNEEHTVSETGKDASPKIRDLEAKLEALQNTLTQLEETKKQLSAEREKTNRLTEELEEQEKQKNYMLSKQYPPVLLISSPADGYETASNTVQLSGVVEDNIGLDNVELYINDKIYSPNNFRGLVVAEAKRPTRYEFNERLPLAKGINRIKVRVTDTDGQVTEKAFAVRKIQSGLRVWAVVIGIDAYPNIPKLKYGVRDARAFYSFLIENNRVPAENVTLLVNEQATLTNLRSMLGTKLKQNAGREDMTIIYFAGHGATERDIMSPDGDGLEKYVLPYDADPKDLYASALPMREISHIIHRIQSERLVFIADACYSGASGGRTVNLTGVRSTMSDAFLDRIAAGKGRVIITASGANEVSLEKEELQHGVFTYYLLKGLKGAADFDKDGLVTVDEAYRYVSDNVPKATAQEQHPVKKGAVEGQLVLGVVSD